MLTIECKQPFAKRWYTIYNRIHRVGGSSWNLYYQDGRKYCEAYVVHGLVHRLESEGPAHIEWRENGQLRLKRFVKHSELHREAGPALIRYDIDGKIIDETYAIDGCTTRIKRT